MRASSTAELIELPNRRIVSRSIDDRIGAFVVLEALRRYAARPGAARVVAAATAQEEIGYSGGGARVAAHSQEAHMAIAVDVTFATDHPGVEKKELGEHSIGGGPALTRGSVVSPVAFGLLRDTADRLAIPYTRACGGSLHEHRCRRDAPHTKRRGDGAAVDPESLHALAERDGVAG